MAEFFDDKQEVMDFELTDWGKYLLSIGKFKPAKYAFFDDGVLYDSSYAGSSSEPQKEVENRIFNETPRLKSITKVREKKGSYIEYDYAQSMDVPTFANPLNSLTNKTISDKVNLINRLYEQSSKDKFSILDHILGTANSNTSKSPSFNVRFLKAPLSSSAEYLQTNHKVFNIPQLNVDLEYKIAAFSGSLKPKWFQQDSTLSSQKFKDGSYIAVEPNFLLLDITEENTDFQSENFKIELFEVKDSNELELKTLKMLTANDGVNEQGFLEDDNSLITWNFTDDDITKDDVEYYFNISLDSQISKALICSSVAEIKQNINNIKFDDEFYDCKEIIQETNMNIYDQEASPITKCD